MIGSSMLVDRKRKHEEINTSFPSESTSNVEDRVSSLFRIVKRKVEKRAQGERVLLASDLRSFMQLNPSYENLQALLKASGPQSFSLIKKILDSLDSVVTR